MRSPELYHAVKRRWVNLGRAGVLPQGLLPKFANSSSRTGKDWGHKSEAPNPPSLRDRGGACTTLTNSPNFYLSFVLAGFGSSFVGSEGVIAASASALVRVRTWMSFKPETVE